MEPSNGSVPVVRLVSDDGELHECKLVPGGECPACHRQVPKVAKDAAHGRTRDRLTVTVPTGEEGVLDEMLLLLVEKYAPAWPEDARAAREGVGLALVGERSWKYRALHFAVYAALNVPGLEPVEEGG